MKLMKRTLVIAFVLVSCVGCDQLTKHIARQSLPNSGPLSFFKNVIRLQYIENPGAFLSLGAGSSEHVRFWMLTFFTGVLLAGMLIYLVAATRNSPVKTVTLSLVVGGGIGNLIDRFSNGGRVIDFMNVGIGPVRTGIFNVADVAISAGVIWFLYVSFRESKKKL